MNFVPFQIFVLNIHNILYEKLFLTKIRGIKKRKKEIITPCVTAVVQGWIAHELVAQSLHRTGNCAAELLNLSSSSTH